MHCHCGTNNRSPRWTFTDPWKPEVRPGAREESAAPAWLPAPATERKCIYWGLTLDVDRHYIGSVTATTHQEKGIITLESNSLRGTVLPAPHILSMRVKNSLHNSNITYLSVQSPPLPILQDEPLPDVSLNDGQTRSEKIQGRLKILLHWEHCVVLVASCMKYKVCLSYMLLLGVFDGIVYSSVKRCIFLIMQTVYKPITYMYQDDYRWLPVIMCVP